MRTILIMLLLAAIPLTGCAAQQTDQVQIGVILPLTGPLAEYGIATMRGIELARGETESDTVFLYEDSAYNNLQAISAFHKLTDQDEVEVVMNWGYSPTNAITSLVDTKDVAVIGFTYDETFTVRAQKGIRTWSRPEAFGKVLLEHARKKGYKKIGILKTELEYLNSLLAGLQKHANDERVYVIDTFQFEDNDFRTSLLKIEQDPPDVLCVFLVSGQISQFYKAASQRDLSIPTLGSDFFESQAEINAAQGGMEGAVYANMDVSTPFRAKYFEKYGDESQIAFAGSAYDWTKLVLSVPDLSSPEAVIGALERTQNVEGSLGVYNFEEKDGDRYLSQPIVLKVIQDGTISVCDAC
ncbi:MAG: ABC transporter substrate-binding protein [Candidatus Woesearchaeota archaeon]|jgi:branched-chain amino acid transport system substrate-binding protein|nr:ABC transporter substrate-binding protein [Candidatus Woesearchaeota archaeon]